MKTEQPGVCPPIFSCWQGALVLVDGVSQYLHPASGTKTPGVLPLCQVPAPASRHEAGREQAWEFGMGVLRFPGAPS